MPGGGPSPGPGGKPHGGGWPAYAIGGGMPGYPGGLRHERSVQTAAVSLGGSRMTALAPASTHRGYTAIHRQEVDPASIKKRTASWAASCAVPGCTAAEVLQVPCALPARRWVGAGNVGGKSTLCCFTLWSPAEVLVIINHALAAGRCRSVSREI